MGDRMSTLDDMARVERELRESFPPTEQMAGYNRRAIYGWADTIAAFIAAQREREAAGVKVPPKIERHQTIHSVGYRHGWNDCRDDTISMNKPKRPLPAAPSGKKEPAP